MSLTVVRATLNHDTPISGCVHTFAREGDAPARSGNFLSKPHDPPATSPATASLTRHRLPSSFPAALSWHRTS